MLMDISLIWELARKDLRLFLADRRGVLLCFAVPILLASFFGTIFRGQGTSGLSRIRIEVADEDQSQMSQKVVTALQACEHLEVTRTSRQAGQTHLHHQGSGVLLILESGFGKQALHEQQADLGSSAVSLIHHPGSAIQSMVVEGLVTEMTVREAAETLLGPLLAREMKSRWNKPFVINRSSLMGAGIESLDSYSHSFCGMSLQYLLFLGMDSGLMLLRERRQGIWRRLRTSPVPLSTLLAGRLLATLLIALAQLLVTFLFGWLVFGIRFHSLPGFLVVALASALLASATGLVVAALGGSEGRARSLSILVILVLSMLGGLWLPSFLMPAWIQTASLALPTTWAVRALEGVTWQGMGFLRALQYAGILILFCTVFVVTAWMIFVRSEARLAREGDH